MYRDFPPTLDYNGECFASRSVNVHHTIDLRDHLTYGKCGKQHFHSQNPFRSSFFY